MSDSKKKLPAAPRVGGRRTRTAARVPSSAERAQARTVVLAETEVSSVGSIMQQLPDPAELPPGTLVLVPGDVRRARSSFTTSVLAVFGRTKTVAPALRCSALIARGYVRVGVADDEHAHDLAWGYTPDA